MMVCITIIAVLMIFCLSLLAVAYSLYSTQNNSMQEDKNAEAAKSLAMAIREELCAASEESNLCKYLRFNIAADGSDCWPYYAPGEDGHGADAARRYFNLKKSDSVSINGIPSSSSICMWWTKADESDPGASVHLFVEVECLSGSQSYVIRSEYELVKISGKSIYNKISTQPSINPAMNEIDKNVIWRWRLVESE